MVCLVLELFELGDGAFMLGFFEVLEFWNHWNFRNWEMMCLVLEIGLKQG